LAREQELPVSKNYELLRETGKDLELFHAETPQANTLSAVPSHLNGGGRVREEVLRLIQRVFLTGAPGAPRLVVFTGVDYGNGCSWVCARAAEALAAHVDGTVCVVEANLNTQSLHRYFGVTKGGGAADAALKRGPIHNLAQSIRGTNLWLMPGQALCSDTGGSMSPEHLKARFAELGSEFHYVLVDAPPAGENSESLVFGRLADGVVLVVEAHATRREAARKVKENLEAANVRLLGAVLNKRRFPIPEAIYSRI
jgi:Mrp family chromosome partitioning ATPase